MAMFMWALLLVSQSVVHGLNPLSVDEGEKIIETLDSKTMGSQEVADEMLEERADENGFLEDGTKPLTNSDKEKKTDDLFEIKRVKGTMEFPPKEKNDERFVEDPEENVEGSFGTLTHPMGDFGGLQQVQDLVPDLDKDKDGYLSLEEATALFKAEEKGNKIPKEDMDNYKELFNQADFNQDGKLEFKKEAGIFIMSAEKVGQDAEEEQRDAEDEKAGVWKYDDFLPAPTDEADAGKMEKKDAKKMDKTIDEYLQKQDAKKLSLFSVDKKVDKKLTLAKDTKKPNKPEAEGAPKGAKFSVPMQSHLPPSVGGEWIGEEGSYTGDSQPDEVRMFDKDHDEQLSYEEVLDSVKDDKLTKKQYVELKQMFNASDINRDGRIALRNEADNFMDMMGKKWPNVEDTFDTPVDHRL